ncbi:Uncharacterised protein [uncultured Blautia sp.]|nr:Uncharacterised protein [uncultured Blautia sp.]
MNVLINIYIERKLSYTARQNFFYEIVTNITAKCFSFYYPQCTGVPCPFIALGNQIVCRTFT